MATVEVEIPELNIGNICGGAVPERFEREVRELLRNMKDPNTDPEQTRGIVLKFKFKPAKTRDFAEVEFAISRKEAAIETVSGSVFLRGQGVNLRAYVEDPRQTVMFANEANATDAKQ